MEFVVSALTGPRLRTVRRRVFRQLVESLVYEGALETRRGDGNLAAIDGVDDAGRPVRYEFEAERRHSFGRVRAGVLWRVSGTRAAEADSVTRFLDEVRGHLAADPARLANFARELEETILKDTLAQHARAPGDDDLSVASYHALEASVTDGHLYHPVYKSRMGFDVADNLAYGPEFANPIRPLWIAAHRSISHVATTASAKEHEFLAGQLDTETLGAFRARIAETGATPEEYTMLPVHPWQWRERVPHAFAAQLASRELVVLGEDPHQHLAQQSIRTLSCVDAPERAYLKLSLSIVNTSTSRVLAPHTVRNAAPISDWLHGILAADGYLRDELGTVLLRELHGVCVDPAPAAELVRDDSYGALGCIWRESLHGKLSGEQRAVPFTALTARALDGTPLIDPWVRELGVVTWVRELLRVSMLPVVHLLRCHGIAIEAHAQNMILVHRNGRPSRVALRDFHDGVRFCRAALAEPERCPELFATPPHHANRNSFVQTDDTELVADFVLDAFLFINLGELAMFLRDAYLLPEPDFWALAREVLAEHQRRFPAPATSYELTKPTIGVEQLTMRRLLPDTELRLHTVPNPLAA